MIPLSLTVRNFLSYGEPSQTLDFRGLHVICLSGENGHGKSALLDAMTWALFGKARANTDDELLHHGASEMHVLFDLELNGVPYRVSRVRTSRGKTRLTLLDLLVSDLDGAWRSLNGNNVRETERAIEHLLGMNYQTFINSAFLLQGRADEFTIKPPGERKRVLADVLNLEAYERLATRAKERRQSWLLTATEIKAELLALDRQVERLPEARATLELARSQRAAADAALPPAEALLEQLRSAQRRLEQKRQEQHNLCARHDEVQAQIRDHQQRIATQEARLESAVSALAERRAVERDYACWLEQRAIAQDYAARLLQLQPLLKEQQESQRAVEREEARLREQVAELNGKLKSCIQEAAKGAEAENLLDAVLAEITALEGAPQAWEALLQRQGDLRESVASLKAQHQALDQTLSQLRARYTTLGNGDTPCPICEQPLTPAQRERLRAGMQADADQCKRQQQEHLATISRHESTLKQLPREIADQDRKRKSLEQAKRTEAALRDRLRAAECARTEVQQLQRELDAVALHLERGDFALEQRAILVELAGRLSAVAYDGARHQAAECRAAELATAEAHKRQLDEAVQVRSAAEESLAHLRSSLATWEAQDTDIQARLAALAQELAGSEGVEADFQRQQDIVSQLQADVLAAAGAVAAAEAGVAQLEHSQRLREERLTALKAANEQQAIYADLTDAFGRNGVQAMLIDEAIPMIEQEANKLLGAMSDGRMTVSLETQRQAKNLTTVETLDVRISDDLGTRNYELYSGGEAFRVNFALRVALSRLLAHRAGTPLQTLVIDEGFGSQDAAGRERVQAVLHAIQADFACIVVITHLDELKDWFATRVEVFKDGTGSHLKVVAA